MPRHAYGGQRTTLWHQCLLLLWVSSSEYKAFAASALSPEPLQQPVLKLTSGTLSPPQNEREG